MWKYVVIPGVMTTHFKRCTYTLEGTYVAMYHRNDPNNSLQLYVHMYVPTILKEVQAMQLFV